MKMKKKFSFQIFFQMLNILNIFSIKLKIYNNNNNKLDYNNERTMYLERLLNN